MVERHVANVNVEGSTPFTRFQVDQKWLAVTSGLRAFFLQSCYKTGPVDRTSNQLMGRSILKRYVCALLVFVIAELARARKYQAGAGPMAASYNLKP